MLPCEIHAYSAKNYPWHGIFMQQEHPLARILMIKKYKNLTLYVIKYQIESVRFVTALSNRLPLHSILSVVVFKGRQISFFSGFVCLPCLLQAK